MPGLVEWLRRALGLGEQPASTPDDERLISAIKLALAGSQPLQKAEIIVKSTQGKVNLSGWLQYPKDSETARRIVGALPGVKSVSANFRTWNSDNLSGR